MIFCSWPDMGYKNDYEVLQIFINQFNYTISLFDIDSIDIRYYTPQKDASDQIYLLVMNCSLMYDYYGNDEYTVKKMSVPFYLNENCASYYDFNIIRNYLCEYKKIALYYNYSRINDRTLY